MDEIQATHWGPQECMEHLYIGNGIDSQNIIFISGGGTDSIFAMGPLVTEDIVTCTFVEELRSETRGNEERFELALPRVIVKAEL